VQFYDGDPSDGVQIGAPVDVPGLPGNMAATITTSWDAPTEGWHDIFVVVDSDNDIDEVLEDNNVASGRVFASALNARAVSMRVEGGAGSSALPFSTESTISVSIESTGPGTIDSASVRLFIGDPSAGGLPVGSDRIVSSVPAGTQREVTFPFTPTQLGSFKLFALVDPDDEIMEFDEMDNEAELAVNVGHPPTWTVIPTAHMVEDYDKAFDLTKYLTDFDTEVLDLEVSVLSIGTNKANVTLQGKVLLIDPDQDWFGSFDVELVVTDGEFDATTSFGVLVEPRNDPPRFRNTGNIMPVSEGERFHYIFDAFDPDGDPVTFTDNSELFDVSTGGEIDFTPTFEDISMGLIHVFRVIASDGTDQAFYPITLEFELLNTAPMIDLPEEIVLVVGESFSFVVDGEDREDDPLTYSEDSDFFEIIPGTGQILFTPTQSDIGEHNLSVTVTDGTVETTAYVTLYIYDAETEARDTTNVSYAVLAGQLAIIAIGLLYIFNFRRRKQREAERKAEEE
jgi:hypothetical protein